jgi:hypothetical protein
MMRFTPCFLVVELMRAGASPTAAATTALRRIARFYPHFTGAIVAVNAAGTHGAASYGPWHFTYSVRTEQSGGVVVVDVPSLPPLAAIDVAPAALSRMRK